MTSPKTVAELRAEMAEGCRKAARVYEQAERDGLGPLAAHFAAGCRRDAERNDALANKETDR